MPDDLNTSLPADDKPWYSALSEEQQRHIISRGYDKYSAAEAATRFMDAHREAQATITRMSSEPSIRIPQNADDAQGWAEVYKRLGKPENLDGYKVEGLKYADGTNPDEQFVGTMKALAHELNLPADKAQALAQKVMSITDMNKQTSQERVDLSDQELRRAWGPQHDYFNFRVGRAMEILGMPREAMEFARQSGPDGYMKFMDGMRNLAAKMGEADMLHGDRGNMGGDSQRPLAISPEEAANRLKALSADPAFGKRFAAGEKAAMDEMDALARVIADARAGNRLNPAYAR